MNATSSLWEEARTAEILSASVAPNMETIGRLADLYDRLGMDNEGLALFKGAPRFGFPNTATLPFLIDSLLKKRNLEQLNQAIQEARAIRDRPLELRRPLARALSMLRQVLPAVEEWANLIAGGNMNTEDWTEFARFLIHHGSQESLGSLLENSIKTGSLGARPPVFFHCVCRSRIESDPDGAKAVLPFIKPNRISDPEIALDLAILAWRLADYNLAARACRRTLALDESSTIARSVRASAASFAGNTERLKRHLSVPFPAVDLVQRQFRERDPEGYVWGWIASTPSGDLTLRRLPWVVPEKREMELPDGEDVPFSFSVLPRKAVADPYEILPFVDFSVPHLMLQQHGMQRIHAFMGTSGKQEWCWYEVRVRTARDPEGPVTSEMSRSSSLFKRAVAELKEMEEEEL